MRIAVIGAGIMGSNHARVLSKMKNVDIAISDVNRARVDEVANTFDIGSVYDDHTRMLKDGADGVIVAVPSNIHRNIFDECIDAGVPVLVEKPMAENLADAVGMIEKAQGSGVPFTVGHVERFNPVVSKIKSIIGELGDIYLVNTVRAGPFPKRLYGMRGGVLVDLAVHDVDIIEHLLGNIEEVYSQIIRSGAQEIYAKALLRIGKINGSSEFSWVSPKRTRTIEIYGTNGMLRGDYYQQILQFYENPDSIDMPASSNLFEDILLRGNISEGKLINYPIKKDEPLKLELQNFIDTIKGREEFLVKPQEALDALKVTLSILESGKNGKPVTVR